MLALATHEPNFRVLREDVFAESQACRICGQDGHFAAQCTSKPDPLQSMDPSIPKPVKKTSDKKKPFIFLDVATLREYLEIELNDGHTPFPFDLERAIDDWVFLIFFVGNDFLPHLPSLEIREGAIDTLLRIWKAELPRMGGYLTNHGQVVMDRAEIILEGLARSENDIFRRRKEGENHLLALPLRPNLSMTRISAEERQNQNAKRRKLEQSGGYNLGPDASQPPAGNATPQAPSDSTIGNPGRHSLPRRPVDPFAAPAPVPPSTNGNALGGSNAELVHNRAAIRMANMSAAEAMKAELAARIPLGRKPPQRINTDRLLDEAVLVASQPPPVPEVLESPVQTNAVSTNPTNGTQDAVDSLMPPPSIEPPATVETSPIVEDQDPAPEDTANLPIPVVAGGIEAESPRGTKRKADDLEEPERSLDDSGVIDISDALEEADDDTEEVVATTRKINPDGTVDQPDTVRYCPHYRLFHGRRWLTFEIGYGSLDIARGTISKSLGSSLTTWSSERSEFYSK